VAQQVHQNADQDDQSDQGDDHDGHPPQRLRQTQVVERPPQEVQQDGRHDQDHDGDE